ncbi:MAG: proline--tRNA ligase, partial [Muribaculaceae bacterium]|nr:proline--tRNA ligase [Muribaculaceae bacterium]
IYKNNEQLAMISEKVAPLIEQLKALGIRVKYDDADNRRPGFKFADYELKGVPVRLAIGARDIENGTVELMRRDTLEKQVEPLEGIADFVKNLLEEIQQNIFDKALARRKEMTRDVDTWEQFKEEIEKGGFLMCHWDGTPETEERIKAETKATIRCIPVDAPEEEGKDMLTGLPSHRRVVIARNY